MAYLDIVNNILFNRKYGICARSEYDDDSDTSDIYVTKVYHLVFANNIQSNQNIGKYGKR